MRRNGGRAGRLTRRIAMGAAVALVGAVLAWIAAPAGAAATSIVVPAGPLDRIDVSDGLNCAAHRAGDDDGAFFGDSACMTAVSTGGTLYLPSDVPGANGLFPFGQPINAQLSGVTGTGTGADPYRITSSAILGSALGGVTLNEVDSYVAGQESYRTDVTVSNLGADERITRVYKAFDCNLQNSDFGFGDIEVDPPTGFTTSVGCRSVADPDSATPQRGARVESITAITPDALGFEGDPTTMWQIIADQNPMPATCACADYIDNAVAIGWNVRLQPGEHRTYSSLTTISPGGAAPLTTSVVADHATVTAGGADGYTVTIANPNPVPKVLRSISDHLPDGFAYVAGSSSGATTADPDVDVDGTRLTWSGPITVPPGGTTALHFGVTASSTAGTYLDDAGADAGETAVGTADQVAPVVVGDTTVDLPPTVDAGADVTGAEGAPLAVAGTVTDPDSPNVSTHWTVTPGADVDAGAACTPAADQPSTTFVCDDDGTFTFTLTGDDGVNPPVSDSVTAHVANADPVVQSDGTVVDAVRDQPVTVGVGVSDPGTHDAVSCSFDWGDGTASSTAAAAAGRCTADHSFSSAGSHTVAVTATDDDGGHGAGSVGVLVTTGANTPPSVTIAEFSGTTEGAPIAAVARITDPDGPSSTVHWSATPGAGVDAGGACTFADPAAASTTMRCTDDGTYSVTVQVDDGVNPPVGVTVGVAVANVAPTLTVPAGSVAATVGVPVTVTLPAADAGTNDPVTCTVAWADGATGTATATGGSCALTHTFTTAGAKAANATAADDDGGTTGRAFSIVVAPVTTAQRIRLVFTGGYKYTNEQAVTVGKVAITRDKSGVVTRMTGKVTMPGVQAATMTVTFDISRFFVFSLWYGTVSWRDGTFTGAAPLINTSIRSTATSVSGAASWYTTNAAHQQYNLAFQVSG